ncbi:hypothetical protein D3C72_1046910 [compost metagenome]
MQGFLHALAEFGVLAGDHGGGQGVIGDLLGQVGAGNHADACIRGHLFENLAHQLEALRLDALGGADQELAGQLPGHRLQHLAQGAGGHGDEDQLAIGEDGGQVGVRLDPGENLHALEITGVLTQGTDRLGLLRVAHPVAHALAVLGQQVGDGGAEAAAAEHRDGLLFSHNGSM